jgi:hypothetical protein
MISLLLDHLMADDATDGEKIVLILCEWTAGTWVYFSILDFRDGVMVTGTLFAALAIIFAVLGVKWRSAKAIAGPRLASIVEGVASNRLYRWPIYTAIGIAVAASVSIRVYHHYRRPSSIQSESPTKMTAATSPQSETKTLKNVPKSPLKPEHPNPKKSPTRPIEEAMCPPLTLEFRNNHVGPSLGQLTSGQKTEIYGIDNEGQIGTAMVGGVNVHPVPGGEAAVIKNRQSGKIDSLTYQNSQIGNEEWWLDLAARVDDAQNKDAINKLLDGAGTQLENAWTPLSKDRREVNELEWKQKRRRIIDSFKLPGSPFNEMHICPTFIELLKSHGERN